MTEYKPGLHILATFSAPGSALTDAGGCKALFDNIIAALALQKVGEVYHSFAGAGFTAVVCLTESHVSIHTWPEHGLATFDVFLSNFEKDNTKKVRSFFMQVVNGLGATIVSQQEINR